MNYIDEVLKRAEKATPGPWEYYEGEPEHRNYAVAMTADGQSPCGIFPAGYEEKPIYVSLEMQNLNGEFIAHARTDVPELCARLKKAIKELRAIEAYLKNEIDPGNLDSFADKLEAPIGKQE